MPSKRKLEVVDLHGFLEPKHWLERASDQNYRDALLDALAEIQTVPAQTITEIYVSLLLDVFGSWYEENRDRFKPYAIATRRGKSLFNEKRFAAVILDEIPTSHGPLNRLIESHTLPVVLAVLMLHEIDSLDGSLIVVLKAHGRLLRAQIRRISVDVADRVLKRTLVELGPALRIGRKIAEGRKLGGQRTGSLLRSQSLNRNARIRVRATTLRTTRKKREIAGVLAREFNLTSRRIRGILKTFEKEETS